MEFNVLPCRGMLVHTDLETLLYTNFSFTLRFVCASFRLRCVSLRFVSLRFASFRFTSLRFVSFHFASFRFTSFHCTAFHIYFDVPFNYKTLLPDVISFHKVIFLNIKFTRDFQSNKRMLTTVITTFVS